MSLLPIEDAPSSGVRGGGEMRVLPPYIYGIRRQAPPPPRDPWAGVGWGPRDPPPIFGSRNSKKEELA